MISSSLRALCSLWFRSSLLYCPLQAICCQLYLPMTHAPCYALFPPHCPLNCQVGPADGFGKTICQAASYHQPATASHVSQMPG